MNNDNIRSLINTMKSCRRAIKYNMYIDIVMQRHECDDETPYHARLFVLLQRLLQVDLQPDSVLALLKGQICTCECAMTSAQYRCINFCLERGGCVSQVDLRYVKSVCLCAAADQVCHDIRKHIEEIENSREIQFAQII